MDVHLDDASCRLSLSDRTRLYNASTQTWIITDEVLEELENDVQAVVACAAPDDIILFSTNNKIRPQRSIVISRNLTITAQPEGPLLRDRSITETEKKVKFSCPPKGDLILVRSGSSLFANLIFEECSGTGTVVSIDISCDENSAQDIRFLHVEFSNLSFSGNQQILDVVQPSCAHLSMENVTLRGNQCGAGGCMSLSLHNTLRHIQVVENGVEDDSMRVVAPSVFVLGMRSETEATNVSGSGNEIRLFNVNNSTLNVKKSVFEGNAISGANSDVRRSVGGCILASNYSVINIKKSHFRSNSGLNGGAIYAQNSTMDIRDASFHGNNVTEAGSAINLLDGSLSLENITITNNSADLYGTVLIGRSTATITGVMFLGNSARSYGGGLSFHDSNVTVLHSKFENNSAGYSGGAIYANTRSTLDVSNTTFQGNSAESNGGGIYAWNAIVSLTSTKFTINTGDSGGGCYFSNVNATMSNLTFSKNRATDGSGGGVYINLGTLNGHLTTFEANQASGQGAGMFCRDMRMVSFSASHFKDNIARQSGGGIYGETLSNMSLSVVCFENNTARQSGGGIYGEDVADMSSSGVRFENNVGRSGGGGYYRNVIATMHNLTVARNRASDGSGGGFYLELGAFHGVSARFKANRASGQGGGIYGKDLADMSLSGVRFHRNSGSFGGALCIYNTKINISHPCVFLENNSTVNGGSMYHKASQSTISSCRFENNTALSNGSMWIGDHSISTISNCTFEDSMASFYGGGLRIYDNTQVTIVNSSFLRCKTNDGGGAISLSTQSSLTISKCKLFGNRAYSGAGIDVDHGILTVRYCKFKQGRSDARGGGICATNGTITIHRSIFDRNSASKGAGGGVCLDSSSVTIKDARLVSNKARNYGGIQASKSTVLKATNLFLDSNVAVENGGGLGIKDGSSLLCNRCDFRNNKARSSGGLYVQADDSILVVVVVQLQDSIFMNNTASSYGGGFHFNRSQDSNMNCSPLNMTCGRVALLNTKFVNNTAASSGSAILTTDPKGVLVSCRPMEPQRDFIDQDLLSSLHHIHPKSLCESWTGNRIATSKPSELNVSTFGQDLSFSIKDDDNIWVTGDVESGFVLENVTSGRWLPSIQVTVLDAYGNGPSYTISGKFEARMESSRLSSFFNETRIFTIIDGSGTIPEIASLKPPGNYRIEVVPSDGKIQNASITVHVRDCLVGEEFTSHDFCQPCNAVSYSFNATKDGECAPCPNVATCETRYIIPKGGYWHKSPCSAHVQACLIEEACTYQERKQKLGSHTASFVDCGFNESILKNYSEALCHDGYKGPLCGSCNASYGLSVQFKCLGCPHAFRSVLTLMFFTLYLLAIASLTIRGGLPLKLKSSRADTPSESIPSQSISRSSSSEEQVVSLEMVAMISQDQVASTEIREKEAQSTSSAQAPIQSNEPELTRWITTEIFKVVMFAFLLFHMPLFKVMINFLQVTVVAASINVEWTERILTMFEATEYVGALSTDALSRPIDCLISSDSASVRSIWRTSLNLLVPVVVMGIFVAMWGLITSREKKGMSYFWKRVILSVIAVTYIAYLGLTKIGVRVFYCVDVYDSLDVQSHTRTRYWAIDTSIRCYEKEHYGLIVISLFVSLIVSLSFPLVSAIYLVQNKAQPGRTDRWTHETMGFLYRAFKEKYVFWESIVMFRKACLSLTVVFSYPLGGQSQGLLALGVLLLCLYLQQTCFPYREEFHKLNYFESGSLLVSCFTFILGQFFSIDQCTDAAKTLVEALIITLNTTFFTFLLVVLVRNGMNHIRAVLKFMGFPIDDNTSWWRLLKLFIKSKKSKAKPTLSTN